MRVIVKPARIYRLVEMSRDATERFVLETACDRALERLRTVSQRGREKVLSTASVKFN